MAWAWLVLVLGLAHQTRGLIDDIPPVESDAEADFGADDDDDAPEPQANLVAISAQRPLTAAPDLPHVATLSSVVAAEMHALTTQTMPSLVQKVTALDMQTVPKLASQVQFLEKHAVPESRVEMLETEVQDLQEDRVAQLETEVAELVGPVVRKLVHAMTAVNRREKTVEQRVSLLSSLAQNAAPASAIGTTVQTAPSPPATAVRLARCSTPDA